MIFLVFRIFCTTCIFLRTDFAFATNLRDIMNALNNPTYAETEEYSKEFTNKSLLIVVPNQITEKEFIPRDEDIERLRNAPYLSDEVLQMSKDSSEPFSNDNHKLRMGGPVTTAGKFRRTTPRVRTRRTTVNRERVAARERDHQQRVTEIIDHMNKHYMSALYLYNETKRIERTHEVIDELRVMAMYLMQPEYKSMKEQIMKCAYVPPKPAPKQIWGKPNNLIINIKKDSINDGVPIR